MVTQSTGPCIARSTYRTSDSALDGPALDVMACQLTFHYSVPGPDEILIKVVATGLNPKDWKVCLPILLASLFSFTKLMLRYSTLKIAVRKRP